MRRLQLRLFGHFEATLNDSAPIEFESQTAKALLAYLAIEREHSQPRSALASLLWGLDAGAKGMTNLRSCLRRVRSALADDDPTTPLLAVGQDSIRLNPQADLWSDIVQFEALLSQVEAHAHRRVQQCPWCMARLTKAVALYRGPVLSDLRINSIDFEEWQEMQREHYHRLAMQALYVLTDHHFGRGAYAQAERYARRQLALESWNEEAHQQMIRVLAATGQRSAAIAQYNRCRAILAAELDVTPMPATTTLYEALRRSNQEPSGATATRGGPIGLVQLHCASQPTTRFIDRTAELEVLLHQLVNPDQRLTTLVGEGGVGKTRLAYVAAQALAGCFDDGIWFVPLADTAGGAAPAEAEKAITLAIAATLGLSLSALEQQAELMTYLRAKELLLVLDNFEHLIAGAEVVAKLLRAAPGVTILVTAREPLNFQSEQIIRLSGLAVPMQDDDPAAATYSAVALFLARAGQDEASCASTPETLAAIVQICRQVHGLPLAIEMAAALTSQWTAAQIAHRLTQQAAWLQSDRRDIPARHRSLQANFEQSWRLLLPDEREALEGAAVFHSGFDRTAAAMVLGANALQLSRLVDKSLLHQDSSGRFELREPLRQFVVGRTENGTAVGLYAKHSAFYLDLLRRQARPLYDHDGGQSLGLEPSRKSGCGSWYTNYQPGWHGESLDKSSIQMEMDNIRVAWLWAIEHAQWPQLATCARALRQVYAMLGLWRQAAHLLELAVAALMQPTAGASPICHCGESERILLAPAEEAAWPVPGPGEKEWLEPLSERLIELAEAKQRRDDRVHETKVTPRLVNFGQHNDFYQIRQTSNVKRRTKYA